MFKRILVPLDGTEFAERAIPFAARVAQASLGSVVFVQVVPPPSELGVYGAEERQIGAQPSIFEVQLAQAADYLADVTTSYAGVLGGIETDVDVLSGAIPRSIFSETRLENVDLIVLCSRGETGLQRWLIGSVAQQAVRHSPVPILVLHESRTVPPRTKSANPLRVLVALDGSTLSETALQPALQFIAPLAASGGQGVLQLLRVVDVPAPDGKLRSQVYASASMREEARQEAETYLKSVADRLRVDADPRLSIVLSAVVSTDVVGTIVKEAEGVGDLGGYTVIALATHGRSGLRRLVMGSVTEHVLDATQLPLLIVRPQAMNETGKKSLEARPIATKSTASEVQPWVGLF